MSLTSLYDVLIMFPSIETAGGPSDRRRRGHGAILNPSRDWVRERFLPFDFSHTQSHTTTSRSFCGEMAALACRLGW
jgi:hypothetical protein